MEASDVKFGSDRFAVLVRVHRGTGSAVTMMFDDCGTAKLFAKTAWRVDTESWRPFVVDESLEVTGRELDPDFPRVGWQCDDDEEETLFIFQERLVVEF